MFLIWLQGKINQNFNKRYNKKENAIQIKRGILINVDASVKIENKHRMCEKVYIWIPAICSCKNGKYLASLLSIQWVRVMNL